MSTRSRGSVGPSSPRRNLSGSTGFLTDEQIDQLLSEIAGAEGERGTTLLGAGSGKQTWSRYIVVNYLERFKWYNPNRDNPDAPKLSKGWAFFEYFTLPRKYDGEGGGHDTRAPPGEAPERTVLYPPFKTGQASLSDWGIGTGMYFSSLQALCLIFVLAGLLNTFNILYYSSAEYDPERGLSVENLSRVIEMVQYSAVCLSREWVVCADCENERTWWDNMFTREFYGTADDGEGGTVTLIDRTTCMPAQGKEGMVNYGTMLLLIVCMGLFSWYLNKREVRFDEDNTTASDYSIVVRNPPEDAVDPDEWRDFFDTFADKGVTLVTVALDNEPLIQKLVARRRDIKLLLHKLPPKLTLDFDDEEGTEKIILDCMAKRIAADNSWFITKIFAGIKSFSISFLGYQDGYFQSEEKIWNRIKNTNDEIRELQQREYNAASVFVTFETEQGQRTALEAMNFSKAEVFLNNSNMRVDQSALFKGRVLECHEAPEPNAVRWTDLNYSRVTIIAAQLATMAITLGLCLLSALILFRSRLTLSTMAFSIILSTFNSIIPVLVRMMVNYEKHYNEGSRQASIYIKITVFRWVNTAVITRLITPFLATLGGRSKDLINTVNALMISELVVSPLLRYLDPFVILDRHYFAPRAKSDEELYFCFRGGWYNLSERFTDFTKVLLLCTFYSAFMPMIWWLGAAILFFQYWMDKFLLLRSWKKAPYQGPEVSKFSRVYFNTAAVCLGIISSGYAYAQSPYTNLCSCNADEPETEVCDGLTTQREFSDVLLLNNTVLSEVLAVDEASYFCNQDNVAFPPTPQNQSYSNQWMTDSQELLCRIYGITCIVLVCAYGFFILGGRLALFIKSLVRGVYNPSKVNQHKDFSDGIGSENFGYVPQLSDMFGFHFPLIISNIDEIDVDLMGWKDPNKHSQSDKHQNYDDHNLYFDVKHNDLHRERNMAPSEETDSSMKSKGSRPIFSVIKHYPPEWAKR